jgi:acetyl-CoA C-acetyltransferase/acetyl-CoA acyltransferase
VLAGGVEMMSQVPFMGDQASYYSDESCPPRSRYVPVALAADRLAETEGLDRAALDAVALESQQRAAAAEGQPRLLRSRIAIGQEPAGLSRDECVRPQTTLESLAAMQPAFGELAKHYAGALGRTIDHRHTVAHAPPICDGASLALIAGVPDLNGVRPRARIVSYAEAGGDPQASLLAGFTAMDRALTRARMTLRDVGAIEFMEAFAVTIAKFRRDRDADPARVNVSGGHLAKGHPMGASGGILLSTLLDVLEARDEHLGLVVASGASGVGAAMIVERLA